MIRWTLSAHFDDGKIISVKMSFYKHQQQFTLTSNSDNNLYRNKSLIVCLIDFCVLSYTHNGRKMVNREWKK